jgi:GNAT superfamily N-acetyltransferase
MKIESLNLHQEFVEILRFAYWNEWKESLMKEFNITNYLEYKLDPSGEYFVAYDYVSYNKVLLGSIALVDSDLYTHKHITNWVAYVYTFPNFRNKGISTKLLQFIINKYNKQFTLTLWCKHLLKHVYEKHGFTIIETLPEIYIMEKKRLLNS